MWRCAFVLVVGCGRIDFAERIKDGGVDSGAAPDGVMPSDAITSSGLLLYLKADDDPTDTSIDSSGNNHSAQCTTTECPTLTSGKYGAAYRFDGVNDRIAVTDDPSFATPGGFTVSVWFRVDPSPAKELAVVSKQQGTGGMQAESWSLWLDSSHEPVFYTGVTNAAEDYLYDYGIVPDNVWTHIAITYDGTTKRIYTNGALQNSRDYPIAFDMHDLYIGTQQRDTLFYYPMVGSIDEVRLYDHPLTQAEIALLAH